MKKYLNYLLNNKQLDCIVINFVKIIKRKLFMKLKIIFAFLIIQFALYGQVSSVDSLETILSQNKNIN